MSKRFINKISFKAALIIFSIIYLFFVIKLLFFQVGSTDREHYFTSRQVHLVPFESTYESLKLAATNHFERPHKIHFWFITIRNIVGNFLLLLPFGFAAPLLFPRIFSRAITLLVITLVLTISIETIQYYFTLGVTDIDDVILNTCGALCGFFLSRLFARKYLKR